jgi:4-aminobutyrate---pyruvate transaminase
LYPKIATCFPRADRAAERTVSAIQIIVGNIMSPADAPVPVNSLSARDRVSVLHPMTDLIRHDREGPLVIERGDGVYVWDDSGKRYIEGVSGLWSISLGFGQERLAEAAYRQMQQLPSYHMFRFKSHSPGITLAERLLAMAPVPMSKVFFGNSGSDANDTQVKIAWYYNNALGRPQKKKIIARQRGYHGVTVACGSLTGLARNHTDFDLPIARVLHTSSPHYWRFGRPGESEEQFATRCADELEQLILAEGPDTVAAFFAEPVMGSGGVIVPPATYFDKIQAVLKKYDVLFVVDEVICGFARLGDMFGTETFGLKPDMITMAKGLSSGYMPISAIMINEKLWQACLTESGKVGVFGHGFTYSGHPVASAVALAALDIYEELDIVARVRAVAPILQEGLRSFADHPLVGEVRGIGLVGALELVQDKAAKQSFPPTDNLGLVVERLCQEEGVILRALGDALTVAPPLIVSEAEIQEILRVIGVALDRAWALVEAGKLKTAA